MELKYKLRQGLRSNRSKNKVYFSCAKADFNNYFEFETDEILKYHDCAVYYIEDEEIDDIEDYLFQIEQMNLFVIPVTSNLLKDETRSIDLDFKLAEEKKIPVLFIMEEMGLAALFESRIGTIQYLDRNQDETSPKTFDEKLKEYLDSILVSDELSKKIRQAFDAYIFLSYRKKDRKEALDVMKCIHSNSFMRDIAIWYDENLVPGEKYDEAILKALDKSSLFAMVVTPSLNENPNYVIENEYPRALNFNKSILPIEAVETNDQNLNLNFKDFPEKVSLKDSYKLSLELKKRLIKEARTPNDDPEHIYYIALAYLNGIDVEKDTDKAVELLKMSAESNYYHAIVMLVNMYSSANGVKYNFKEAIKYQEKLINRPGFDKHEEGSIYSLSKLAMLYSNAGDYQKALSLLEDCYKTAKIFQGEKDIMTLLYLHDLASAYSKCGNHNKSLKLFEECYELNKEVLGIDHPSTIESLSGMALEYLSLRENEKAFVLLEKCYNLRKELLGNKHPNTLMSLNNLAYGYFKLGNYAKSLEQHNECYSLRKEILGEKNPDTIESLSGVAFDYFKLKDYQKATTLFDNCYNLRKEVLGEKHLYTIDSLNNVAEGYFRLNKHEEAMNSYKKCYELEKEIFGYEHPETLTVLSNLAYEYSVLADYDESLKLYKECYSSRKETLGEKHRDTLKTLSNIAGVYENINRIDLASELDLRCYNLRKEVLGKYHPDTVLSLGRYAYELKELGRIDECLKVLEELLEIRIQIYGENSEEVQKTIKTINSIKE